MVAGYSGAAGGGVTMEWISVNDRLPEEGQKIIAVGDVERNLKNYDEKLFFITYWMPLPEPPKGE